MRPDQYNLMLLTTTRAFNLTRCNRLGRGETKLEGDTTLRSGDMFTGSFRAVVDLVWRCFAVSFSWLYYT
jgi:hypothetical protein